AVAVPDRPLDGVRRGHQRHPLGPPPARRPDLGSDRPVALPPLTTVELQSLATRPPPPVPQLRPWRRAPRRCSRSGPTPAPGWTTPGRRGRGGPGPHRTPTPRSCPRPTAP